MQLHNIKTAYGLAESLYGVTPTESQFEELALNAWELIGTKHTRLHRYVGNTFNKVLKLPCNVDLIESVHLPILDAQISTPKTDFNQDAILIEHEIAADHKLSDPYYQAGKYLRYDQGNSELYFDNDYKNVMVVYHGILLDDESGLPLINEKEMRAIAAYVAYASLYREGLVKRDSGLLQLANTVKTDWLQLCNAARIPDHLSQNDMDAILDVKVRWDRKIYGKSFKSIR